MYSDKNIGNYDTDDINMQQFEELYNYITLVDEFKQKEANAKYQLFNISKNEDDITLQQSSTECEEKKLSISYNYNSNINNSNTPIHITKNLELNSSNIYCKNLNKKNSFSINKKSKKRQIINSNSNTNYYSEKDRSLDANKKLDLFKLTPLSSGNTDFNLRDFQLYNNNKSLNLMNLN